MPSEVRKNKFGAEPNPLRWEGKLALPGQKHRCEDQVSSSGFEGGGNGRCWGAEGGVPCPDLFTGQNKGPDISPWGSEVEPPFSFVRLPASTGGNTASADGKGLCVIRVTITCYYRGKELVFLKPLALGTGTSQRSVLRGLSG